MILDFQPVAGVGWPDRKSSWHAVRGNTTAWWPAVGLVFEFDKQSSTLVMVSPRPAPLSSVTVFYIDLARRGDNSIRNAWSTAFPSNTCCLGSSISVRGAQEVSRPTNLVPTPPKALHMLTALPDFWRLLYPLQAHAMMLLLLLRLYCILLFVLCLAIPAAKAIGPPLARPSTNWFGETNSSEIAMLQIRVCCLHAMCCPDH